MCASSTHVKNVHQTFQRFYENNNNNNNDNDNDNDNDDDDDNDNDNDNDDDDLAGTQHVGLPPTQPGFKSRLRI